MATTQRTRDYKSERSAKAFFHGTNSKLCQSELCFGINVNFLCQEMGKKKEKEKTVDGSSAAEQMVANESKLRIKKYSA